MSFKMQRVHVYHTEVQDEPGGIAAYNLAAETLTVADVAALAEGREPPGGAAWTLAPQLDYEHSVAGYLGRA